jgi:hypothetical protein
MILAVRQEYVFLTSIVKHVSVIPDSNLQQISKLFVAAHPTLMNITFINQCACVTVLLSA